MNKRKNIWFDPINATAIAYRNGLKTAFNLGMADKSRVMTMGRAMATYAGDYGDIIGASGRTSPGWNAVPLRGNQ